MFTKILVGYDGSAGGKLALVRVAHLAKLAGAQVTALWVQPPRAPDEATGPEGIPTERWSKDIATVSSDTGVPIASETLPGQVARTLGEYAKAGGFDLIALGQSQRSQAEGRMLGDIADCVSHIAPCSVLIVKP